jgi:hypothetical protein
LSRTRAARLAGAAAVAACSPGTARLPLVSAIVVAVLGGVMTVTGVSGLLG